MAKYQVWVRAEVELDIEADSLQEVLRIAEDEWYDQMNYSGEYEIDDVYKYED